MTITQRIHYQRQIIIEKVTPLIDNDYIFIDLPYYSNIGDTLIWKGTECFLSSIPYRCISRASFQTFQFPMLPDNVVILMMGGGNWGDLYAPHNKLRRDVVNHYQNNRIIILPQTVYYEGARAAASDAAIFRRHNKLTICARDKYSYRFLKAFGFCKRIILVPDMAFCINTEELLPMAKPGINKDLLFKRVDKEKGTLSSVAPYLIEGKYDISDWPLYEGSDPSLIKLFDMIKANHYAEADDYATETYLPTRVRTGVEFISQYDRVFSNRLHGAILSILLGKKVYICDNSYGKNSQYYNTWLGNTDGIQLIGTKMHLNLKRRLRFLVIWLKVLIADL